MPNFLLLIRETTMTTKKAIRNIVDFSENGTIRRSGSLIISPFTMNTKKPVKRKASDNWKPSAVKGRFKNGPNIRLKTIINVIQKGL